jgi:hypothetical protein
MDNHTQQLNVLFVDGEAEPKVLNKRVVIRRYIGAFFIYIVYWLTLWGAIKKVVGVTLSPQKARELVEEGHIDSVWEYGWGDHYIWYLIVICFTTFSCAALAGATAKKNGRIIATIANVPVLLLMILMCYLHYTSRTYFESPIAWGIVLPLSVIGSAYFAFLGGVKGEHIQQKEFSDNTILGIRSVHWWWLIFPLNLSIQEIVPKIGGTIVFLVGSTLIRETKYSVLFFLMFVALATSIYFIVWGWYKSFRLLSTGYRTNLSRSKIALRVLFYLFGIPLLFDVFYILIYILIGRFSQL